MNRRLQFDHLGQVKRPFQILPGGYQIIFRNGKWSDVTGSKSNANEQGATSTIASSCSTSCATLDRVHIVSAFREIHQAWFVVVRVALAWLEP